VARKSKQQKALFGGLFVACFLNSYRIGIKKAVDRMKTRKRFTFMQLCVNIANGYSNIIGFYYYKRLLTKL
jgi:hypothetical protein